MIKTRTIHWQVNEDTKALLFFAQRMNEALFNYTPEKYKASALYCATSCLEMLSTITEYDNKIWPIKTLETVYSEFRCIYNDDDTAKSLVGEIDSYYLINIDEKNLNQLKSNLELLYYKITPPKYLQRLKEQIVYEISESKRNIVVEKLALRFISVLLHIGYSQDYIYYKTKEFFFRGNRIENTSVLQDYFEIFDLKPHQFEVYIKADSLFDKIKDACSRFKTEIVTEVILSPENIRKLEISSSEYLIKVSEIKCLDPQKAKIYADKTLSKIGDLFTFFHHKQRLIWGKNAIVYNKITKEEIFLRNTSSSMHKGYDFFPKAAAERLDLMLRTFELHKDSFFRFNRSIDFHGTAIDNKYPDNQLLQNWIALETLIVENKNDSKINQILSALVPVLNFEYIKRIFVDLAADIERYDKSEINDIVLQVPEGNEFYEKLAALTVIKSNLPSAQQLFALCTDFPLLSYRIFWLNKNLSNAEKVKVFIKNHTQRVDWHIRRIYRARNLIVHTGQVPSTIDRLVESSHSYLDDFLNTIMTLSTNGKQIRTIDQGIREIELRNRMHLDFLNKSKDVECNGLNFKKLLWGD